jgi:hypothetical protein
MVSAPISTSDLPLNSYVVLGLATCYLLQDGETTEVKVVEPLPSAYLETVVQGIATSYAMLWNTTLEQALAQPLAGLSADEQLTVQPCDDFEERLQAAARSYVSRPSAQTLIAAGTPFRDLNYSTEKKRILNPKNRVSKSDNVKQHKHTHKVL